MDSHLLILGKPLRMQRERARRDPLLSDAVGNPLLGQFVTLTS
jgi:hypothetical protein